MKFKELEKLAKQELEDETKEMKKAVNQKLKKRGKKK